jgi:hypothetical protein
MENPYQSELWRDLFVMLGTTAGALIGLLFVVTSLHLDLIVNDPIFRLRARNNTLHLLIMLVQAGLILMPQPIIVLGAELAVVNLLGLWLPLNFVYIFFKDRERFQHGRRAPTAPIFIVCFLLGIAGSAALIANANWGLYLISVSYLTILIAVALNAWTIMLGVGQTEKRNDLRK